VKHTDFIIARIRDKCLGFERRVQGVAELNDKISSKELDIDTPHVFVVPIDMQPIGKKQDDKHLTWVKANYSTVICVSNINPLDGVGIHPSALINKLFMEIYSAFDHWIPLQDKDKPTLTLSDAIPVEERALYLGLIESQMKLAALDYPPEYEGGGYLTMENSYLWHEYRWSIEYPLIPNGGCKSTQNQPIDDITIAISPSPITGDESGASAKDYELYSNKGWSNVDNPSKEDEPT